MAQNLVILAICVVLLGSTTAFPVNSTQIPTMEASPQQPNTPSPPIEMNSQKSTVTAGISPSPMDGLAEDVTPLPEEALSDNPTDMVPSQSQPLGSSSPSKHSSTRAPEIVVTTSVGKPLSLSPMEESSEMLTNARQTGSSFPASSQDPPIQSPSQEPPIQSPAANATEQTETIPSSEPAFSSSKNPTQASTVLSTNKQSTLLSSPSSNGKSTQNSATSLATQHKSSASSVSNNPSTQNPAAPPQIQLSSLPPMEKSTQNPAVTPTVKPRTTFSSSQQKSTTVTKKKKPFPSSSTSKVYSTQRPTTVTMVTEEEEPLLSAVEKRESSTPSTTTLVVATGVGCSVGAGIMSAILSVILNKVSQKGLPTKKLFKKLRQKAKDQQKKGKDRLEIEEESGENERSSLLDKESDLNSLQDKIEKREKKGEPAAVVDMERGGSAYEMSPLLKKGSTFDPFLDKLDPPKVDKSVQTEPNMELGKEELKEDEIMKQGLLENGPLQSKEANLDSLVQNTEKKDLLDTENSNKLGLGENNGKTPVSPSEESASNSSEEGEKEEKQQLLRDDVKGVAEKSLDRGEIAPLLGRGSTQL